MPEEKIEGPEGPKNIQQDQSKAILVLVLNILIPGVGTMVYGDTGKGIGQLVLYIVGGLLTFTFIGAVIGIPMALGAWVWSLIDGINYYKILSGSGNKGGGA